MGKFPAPEGQGELPIDPTTGFWRLEQAPGCSGQVALTSICSIYSAEMVGCGCSQAFQSNLVKEGRTDPSLAGISGIPAPMESLSFGVGTSFSSYSSFDPWLCGKVRVSVKEQY